MKLITTLTAIATTALLAVGCSDQDNSEAVVVDTTPPVTTTYEAPIETPAIEETVVINTDRAIEPAAPTTYTSNLMADELRYRNSDGDVNWDAVPREDVDGFDYRMN